MNKRFITTVHNINFANALAELVVFVAKGKETDIINLE